MKTLEEIRKETEKDSWTTFESMMILAVNTGKYHLINKMINKFATNVAKEALNNASENALLVNKFGNDIGAFAFDDNSNKIWINKQSILNESNIPKL